jgi:hypothetical protein
VVGRCHLGNLGIKSRSIRISLKSLTGHLVSPILRVYAVRRLQGRLAQFSDPELEWLLARVKA